MPRVRTQIDIKDGEKQCSRCKKVKPEEVFVNQSHRIGKECKECQEYRNIKDMESKQRKLEKAQAALGIGEKVCTRCKKAFPEADFIGSKGKTVSNCTTCREYLGEKRKQMAEDRRNQDGPIIGVDGKRKCKRCGCWHDPEAFIGKRGGEVNSCRNCAEHMKKQDERPDRYAKKIARNNETKAYKAYRARKIEEDEEGFRAHNAATYRKWVEETHNGALKRLKQNARIRDIPVEITDDELRALFESNCAYCGHKDDRKMNGVDRMDPTQAYTKQNAVSCCGLCNIAKKCLDPVTFKLRCKHIAKYQEDQTNLHPEAWGDIGKTSLSFKAYESLSLARGIFFDLNEQEYYTMKLQPCHYCGYNKNELRGIDRKNSSKDYCSENCVPCCGECNIMKGDVPYDEFLELVRRVAAYPSIFVYTGEKYMEALPKNKVFLSN